MLRCERGPMIALSSISLQAVMSIGHAHVNIHFDLNIVL